MTRIMGKVKEYAKVMSESELQRNVVQFALVSGWLVMHTRPAIDRSGHWSTPLMGTPGFFDLVLARGGKVIFAELKSEKGRMTAEQKEWAQAVKTCHLWRPSDWLSGTIEKILQEG